MSTPTTAAEQVSSQMSVKASNLKSVFGSGIGRIGAIVAGVALVTLMGIGGVRLFGSKPVQEATGPATSVPATQKQDGMAAVNSDEASKRAAANAEAAKKAAQSGQGYIAPPVIADKNLDRVPATDPNAPAVGTAALQGINASTRPGSVDPQASAPSGPMVATPVVGGNGGQGIQQPTGQQASGGQQQGGQQQAQPAGPTIDPELKKAIMEQIAGVMGSATPQQRRGFSNFSLQPQQQQGQQQAANTQAQAQGQGAAGAPGAAPASPAAPAGRTQQGDPIASVGDTCYATLDNGINSDDTLVVLATIHSCALPEAEAARFVKARLIGRIEKAQDQVRVSFQRIRLPGEKGATPIEAIAVTEDEARSGIGKDIDHHYFSRYFSLGLASILTGYGKAAQQSGGTTIVTGGSTIITQEPMTSKRRTQIALGEIGTAFASEIKRDFNRPTTVSAPRDMGIGVIILNDVMPRAAVR